ncbi:beta-1,3-glucan-binding protein [Patella vulgata]|uniref:beta-1,3-glucan-binding protein n=1 Tax=Patella vulgata TaxID=6465 RepID=UPI0024A97E84|nr:beta-1,3-glucan-binding protein [Patella vulgata]
MTLKLVLVVVLSVYVTDALDNPTFTLSPSGGQFTVKDYPGLSTVLFHYWIDNGDEIIDKATLTDTRVWQLSNPKLRPLRRLQYYAEFYFNTGVVTSVKQKWDRAPVAVLPPRKMRGVVMFREDFNGDQLDINNWLLAVTATDDYQVEFQAYTNDKRNVFVRNGYLYLKPTLTVDSGHFTEDDLQHGVMDLKKTWGVCTEGGNNGCYRDSKKDILPPTLSGRVLSKPNIKYGTITVRAQIPRGDWLWPAIWMMPSKPDYGWWPASGEIDFMEATCNQVMHDSNGKNVGVQRIFSTYHMAPQGGNFAVGRTFTKDTGDWHGFHNYELEWSPDRLVIKVDGKWMNTIDVHDGSSIWDMFNLKGDNPWVNGTKIAPFDKEFYLILNVAVGGTTSMFSDSFTYPYTKPWKNSDARPMANFWAGRNLWLPSWHGDDVAMIIDYVEFRHM